MAELVMDQINIVCSNMEASLGFYRALGVNIPEREVWRTETGPHHVEVKMPGGFQFGLDSQALAQQYNEGARKPATGHSNNVITFRVQTADEVDRIYEKVVEMGAGSAQVPYHTFWGSRYAIVRDPDGNDVGVMSLPDPTKRSAPPKI